MKDRAALVLALVGGANLLLAFDLTSIAVALPSIQVAFGASAGELAWAQNAYALTIAVALPLLGAFGDRIGRARGFGIGLVVFIVAALGCAIAPTIAVLIGTRAVQGIGAAALLTLGLAVLTDTYGTEGVGRVVGLVAACSAVGLGAGPALAGVLVDSVGWRGLLLAEALLAVALGALAVPALRGRPRTPGRTVDALGGLAASTGIGLLIIGIHAVHPGGSILVAVACGLGCAASGWMFIRRERTAARPIMPRRLIDQAPYRAALAIGFLSYAGIAASSYYISLFVQREAGWNAMSAGLLILPITGGIAIGSLLVSRLRERHGFRRPLIAGFALCAVGVVMCAALGLGTWGTVSVIIGGFVSGIGMGIGSPMALAWGMSVSTADDTAAASSGLWTARQVGTAAGFATLALLVSGFDPLIDGVRAMFIASALLLAVAMLVAIRVRVSSPAP